MVNKLFGYFQRPVGAAADVRELEYISALHQTAMPELRTEGTVSAADVRIFLRSRYGLQVAVEDAIDIVKGLSGTNRLPLPEIEDKKKKNKKQQEQKMPTVVPENSVPPATQTDLEIGLTSPQALSRVNYDDTECISPAPPLNNEQLHLFKGQYQKLKHRTDNRRNWTLPTPSTRTAHLSMTNKSDKKAARKHAADMKKMDNLIRYDLVQMTSILLIPTLVRLNQPRYPVEPATMHPKLPPRPFYRLIPRKVVQILLLPWKYNKRLNQRHLDRQKASLKPKPETLIGDVLRLMLASLDYAEDDVAFGKMPTQSAILRAGVADSFATSTLGGSVFPELRHTIVDEDLVVSLLERFGELEAAADSKLVKEMVDMVGGEGTVLDDEAFGKALTGDVTTWPVECEDDLSTTFYDVYGFNPVECNKYRDTEHLRADILAADDPDAPLVELPPVEMPHQVDTLKKDVTKMGKKTVDHLPKRDRMNLKRHPAQEQKGESSSCLTSSSFYSAHSSLKDEVDDHASIESQNPQEDEEEVSGAVSDDEDANRENCSEADSLAVDQYQTGVFCRKGKVPAFKAMASTVDYVADAFRSVMFVTFLFLFYIFACVLFMSAVYSTGVDQWTCKWEVPFFCKLMETIWSWVIFAIALSAFGLIVILPISFGNNQFVKSQQMILFSMLFLAVLVGIPVMEVVLVEVFGIKMSRSWMEYRSQTFSKLIFFSLLISAALVFIEQLRGLLGSYFPRRLAKKYVLLRKWFLPSNISRSMWVKRSGTHKLNSMVQNAHKLHRRSYHQTKGGNSAEQRTLLNFVVHGEKLEDCGGFFWTWRRMMPGYELFRKEGVWIHARLVVGQVSQCLVLVVIYAAWYYGTIEAAENVEKARDDVDRKGPFGSDRFGTDWALWFIPTEQMIYVSFIPGGILSMIMAVILLLLYFPSTVSTILKLRSGVIPTLHDPVFSAKYKSSVDLVYYNLGNMLYALVGLCAFFFVLGAGAIFLIVWPPTQDFMVLVIAWGIGLTVTCVLKMILTMFCRAYYYRALYRTRPLSANVSALALECWHLGLGGGVMLGRLTQFLLAAAFWIGRIDSAFLSDEVEVFGYRFDNVPVYYRMELLAHDAHRHPYMERLAAMYLMRLKHGEHFCSDAGAAWRGLFVLTLFPWLMKYRQGNAYVKEEDEDLVFDEFLTGRGFDMQTISAVENDPVFVRDDGTPLVQEDENMLEQVQMLPAQSGSSMCIQ